jgi:hypothetical protein
MTIRCILSPDFQNWLLHTASTITLISMYLGHRIQMFTCVPYTKFIKLTNYEQALTVLSAFFYPSKRQIVFRTNFVLEIEVHTAVVICFLPDFTLVSWLVYYSTLKVEAVYYSETSVDFQHITRRYIPEERTLSARSLQKNSRKLNSSPKGPDIHFFLLFQKWLVVQKYL